MRDILCYYFLRGFIGCLSTQTTLIYLHLNIPRIRILLNSLPVNLLDRMLEIMGTGNELRGIVCRILNLFFMYQFSVLRYFLGFMYITLYEFIFVKYSKRNFASVVSVFNFINYQQIFCRTWMYNYAVDHPDCACLLSSLNLVPCTF